MAQVVTVDGIVDEDTLQWKVWREDSGESWTIVHELTDSSGRVVRRDSWVNFKGVPVPVATVKVGEI